MAHTAKTRIWRRRRRRSALSLPFFVASHLCIHTNNFSTQFDALFSHQISMSNRSFGWAEFGRRQRRIHLLSFRKYHSIPHNWWWWCFCTAPTPLCLLTPVFACAYEFAHTSIYTCLFIHLILFVLFILLFIHLYQVLKWCIKKISRRTDLPFHTTPYHTILHS